MKNILLSKRLKTVASYLPDGAYFADIGSDHAYLPCYVCLNDNKANAIAGELNQGPYQSAVKSVIEQNLENRISVRKGNGLEVLREDEGLGQVVIAGMGGTLISMILEEGKEKLKGVSRIVAQPNVDAKTVRKWFIKNDYKLVKEEILEEDGHFYEVLVADKGNSNDPYSENMEKEIYFGPYLLKNTNHSAFIGKWRSELDKKQHVLNQITKAKEVDEEKFKIISTKVNWIKEVLENE